MRNIIDRLMTWIIGNEQCDKIDKATNDFCSGKITEAEWMRAVWNNYPY